MYIFIYDTATPIKTAYAIALPCRYNNIKTYDI